MIMKNIFLLLFIFTSFIQLSAQNIAIEKKEWTSVYITKIFTNPDSAKLAYQNIIEKKKIFDRTYDNDIKQLSNTFVKSTFETTSEFDNRKALAINNKKNEFFVLLIITINYFIIHGQSSLHIYIKLFHNVLLSFQNRTTYCFCGSFLTMHL